LSTKMLIWSNVEFVISLILSIIMVVFMKMGIFGITYAQVSSLVFVSIIFLPWFIETLKSGFRYTVFRDVFTYGIHFVMAGIAGWVMNLSDRLLLNLFWGTGAVGLYSVGYRFGNIFQVLGEGFQKQWGYSLYQMGSPENVCKYLNRIVLQYILVMSTLWMGLTLFIREILILLTPAEFHQAHAVVPLVAIGYIFFGLSGIYSAGVHLQRKGKFFWIFGSLGAIVNIGLNFLFIPRYGMNAAALTTMVAFLVQPVGYYWITKKKYLISMPWKEIIQLLILCGGFSIFSYFIVIESLLFSFIEKAFLMLLFLVILNYSTIIPIDDKKRSMQFLRRKLAFRR